MDEIISLQKVSNKDRMKMLKTGLHLCKEQFSAIPVKQEDRPLIGVVGEIFCRLNTFSNNELIRHLEAQGAECWLTGIGEWVLYTNEEAFRRHREEKTRFGKEWLKTFLTTRIMHKDEHALYHDFEHIFAKRPEPSVAEVLEAAHPYLPQEGALGEMVLSTGGAIAYYHRGADGIVDISPFTCMNGIVNEAVYPVVSRDHDDIPIRIFYFDGTNKDLDRDVGIFLGVGQDLQAPQEDSARLTTGARLRAAARPTRTPASTSPSTPVWHPRSPRRRLAGRRAGQYRSSAGLVINPAPPAPRACRCRKHHQSCRRSRCARPGL